MKCITCLYADGNALIKKNREHFQNFWRKITKVISLSRYGFTDWWMREGVLMSNRTADGTRAEMLVGW